MKSKTRALATPNTMRTLTRIERIRKHPHIDRIAKRRYHNQISLLAAVQEILGSDLSRKFIVDLGCGGLDERGLTAQQRLFELLEIETAGYVGVTIPDHMIRFPKEILDHALHVAGGMGTLNRVLKGLVYHIEEHSTYGPSEHVIYGPIGEMGDELRARVEGISGLVVISTCFFGEPLELARGLKVGGEKRHKNPQLEPLVILARLSIRAPHIHYVIDGLEPLGAEIATMCEAGVRYRVIKDFDPSEGGTLIDKNLLVLESY